MIYSIPSLGASFHDSWSSNYLRHAKYNPATYSSVVLNTTAMHVYYGWLGASTENNPTWPTGSYTGFTFANVEATRPVWADPTVENIDGGWYNINAQQFETSYDNTLLRTSNGYQTNLVASRTPSSRRGFTWLEIARNSLGEVLTSQQLTDSPIYIKSSGFTPYAVASIGLSGKVIDTYYDFSKGYSGTWPYLFPSSTQFYISQPTWIDITKDLQPIVQTTTVYKNDVAVSNISSNIYSSLSNEDSIYFKTTACGFGNLSGTSSTSTVYVDDNLITLCSNMSAAVDSRLVGKDPTNSKKVFSTADHTTRTYVRNPNLWCADLIQQLTGMVTYKTAFGVNDSYGGTLITPRHILYVQHALPRGGTVRFVTSNNQTITAIQLSGSNINVFANSTTYPVFPSLSAIDPYHYDLAVITLDRDVSLSGISPLPIAAITPRERTILRLQPAPTIAISQGSNRSTGTTNPNPLSAREMELYTLNSNRITDPNTSTQYPWQGNGGGHILWDGDSGTSHLIVNNNSVYLYRLTRFASGDGATVAALSSQVNYLIRKSDELAGINTGLSATFYSIKQILER